MKDFEWTPEVDPAIYHACGEFLAQLKALMAVDGLAVVLLNQDQSTSRVVFSWESLDRNGHLMEPSGLDATQRVVPVCITLKGNEVPVGALLIHGTLFESLGSVAVELVQKSAQHLAVLLGNILLQNRLENNAKESAAFARINQIVGSQAPVEQVFLCFTYELLDLVDYDRVGLFIASENSGGLIRAYRSGPGLRPDEMPVTRSPLGAGWELVAANFQSCIVDDLRECSNPGWLELFDNREFRSAVIVPVIHGGDTVGVVVLENRLPRAYVHSDEQVLMRAAALLGPAMAVSGARVNQISNNDYKPAADQFFSPLDNSQQLDSLGKGLLADAAHALRSPLSSIKGYSSTLLQTDVSWSPEVRQEFLETIDREADQLTNVINDLFGSMEAELAKVHLDHRPATLMPPGCGIDSSTLK